MKKILITGGSDGLGKAIAKKLKTKDADVIIVARNEDKLQKTAKELSCNYYVCDVSNYKQVEKMFKTIGDIDILINCAGILIRGELDDNSLDDIQKVIEVNLLGTINCTKVAIKSMKKKKSGHIININSQGGLTWRNERSVYDASKWGVTGFSRCLEDEVKKYGIKVTDVMPGKMKTDMFAKSNIFTTMDNAIDTKHVAELVEFIISLPKNINIPEVGIKNVFN